MEPWIEELQRRCEATSQAKVQKAIKQKDGFPSQTTINQVLKGKYPSKPGLERLKMLVEGFFLNRTVDCPVKGELAINLCQDYQTREFSAVNPKWVALWKACQNCENKEKDDE